MKIALVTGASSAIGAAVVRQMSAAGYQVYAGARRVERMAPLAALGASLLALDVTDDLSMVSAINTIKIKSGRIDVLVNNAGYGSYGALEDVPLDEGRRQFEVNVFGMARLTQLVLPMMREARSGTIFNVSSMGGKIYEPFGSWYHATKFAVEGMSDCLRMELEPFGINVVIIEPGAIKTEWSRIASDLLRKYSGQGAYAQRALAYAGFLDSAENSTIASSPDVVASTIMRALKSSLPRTRYATGGGAKPILLLRWLLPDRMFDRFIRRVSRMPAASEDSRVKV